MSRTTRAIAISARMASRGGLLRWTLRVAASTTNPAPTTVPTIVRSIAHLSTDPSLSCSPSAIHHPAVRMGRAASLAEVPETGVPMMMSDDNHA